MVHIGKKMTFSGINPKFSIRCTN